MSGEDDTGGDSASSLVAVVLDGMVTGDKASDSGIEDSEAESLDPNASAALVK